MPTKQDLIAWLDENQSLFTKMADEIWENPELAFREFKASKLQADFLEEDGFSVTWDLGDISTSFVAEWGDGKPIIGFVGEYDALPGLSQKLQTTPEPIEADGPGHGCGHNLLGTGGLAAAVAVKRWLAMSGRIGTVRYYGCPAEEDGSGKVLMARDGVFDDLDAAFNFHPSHINTPSKGSCVGVNGIKFRFIGVASHAGMFPELGRSALDAVELMNVGVNFLREHVSEQVRIHYVITDGGRIPNIVPETAEVWYFIRAHLPDEVEEVTKRVVKIAQGAALMTETRLEESFSGGATCLLSNHHLADLQYEAMRLIGPIEFTDEEKSFAQTINDNYPAQNKQAISEILYVPRSVLAPPLVGENMPALDEGEVMGGSTDVGDLSWITPLSMLSTACWPTSAPAHSWGVVATGGTSIGHKGMMHAAKVMAVAAMDLYMHPEKLSAVREEFEASVTKRPYKSPIPDHIKPPKYKHPYR